VSEELDEAKKGNVLTRTTLSLFYATDFFDQLINVIVPALRAGFIVIADRYVYTLMARDIVRGADRDWVRNLYSPAIVPDAIFYLRISAQQLVERNLEKNSTLDYWESGMDMGLSRDMFDSFFKYQRLLQGEFQRMQKEYKFEMINGNRRIERVQRDLRSALARQLTLRPEEQAVAPAEQPAPPSQI
jgi:dTMP kinase